MSPPRPDLNRLDLSSLTLGERLRVYRALNYLSLHSASKLAHISRTTLIELEQGRHTEPRTLTLMALAQLYGVAYEALAQARTNGHSPHAERRCPRQE